MSDHKFQMLRRAVHAGHIEAIVFDLDGTLYSSKAGLEFQLKPKMVEHTSLALGIRQSEARNLLQKYREEFRSSVLGLQKYHSIDPEEFLNGVYRDLDRSRIVPYSGLSEAMHTLSRLVPLYLLTNSNRQYATLVVEQLGLTGVLIRMFPVEEANFVRKPNLEPYLTLLGRLGVAPQRVLNVDDSYLNLEVAHGLDLLTVLVSNGIADPPKFWEMHKRVYHDAPDYVDYHTHYIADFMSRLAMTT